jgi:hypothetical protein
MKISDLASDAELVLSPTDREHEVRVRFVGVRLRALIAATPTLGTTTDPTAIAPVKTQLKSELAAAKTAVAAVIATMNTYESATPSKLLLLDEANTDPSLLQLYVKRGLLKATSPLKLREKRQDLILALAWSATAVHPQLQASGRKDDLCEIVERRLRLVERMFYGIGVNLHQLKDREIMNSPNGPWKDGAKRVFEYPRLTRKQFDSLCQPATPTSTACQGPGMNGWSRRGNLLVHDFKLADPADSRWDASPLAPADYVRPYKPSAGTAKDAVEKIFTPSENFKERNLLGCDQVLHLLHIESMMVAGNHRNQSDTWFDTVVSGKPAGWLRVTSSWGCKPDPAGAPPPPDPYLGGAQEPAYFEHAKVKLADLQLGDHLIVYNHPIYDRLTTAGVWRLENAMVVQVSPTLFLQGHGTAPLAPATMRNFVIKLCNTELEAARKKVENRLVATPNEPGFPSIPLDAVDGNGEIVRRVAPAQSEYAPAHRKADWWVRWSPDICKGEMSIWAGPKAQRDSVERAQAVKFVTETEVGPGEPYGGFFPLWQPKSDRNGPIKVGGKYTQIVPMKISEPMVATWDWYSDMDEAQRDTVAVIRPRVS